MIDRITTSALGFLSIIEKTAARCQNFRDCVRVENDHSSDRRNLELYSDVNLSLSMNFCVTITKATPINASTLG